eukprot:TRINITY_DN12661_c0_g1_i2.p1 TRINITY_DN12661_c0_g1~~TRINITY_DN12661_c0_g1_i2.p1  ORF type:complete len:263 (+),score=112.83 TRINITY_DN12661_c0_g1_i2:34-789(+)
MLRAVGRRWCSGWAGGGGEGAVPSLHLPPYFELREVGKNFRYKSDPDWVIDTIHKDCVREEGLTYVSEAATYTVTFFQIINYCAKRGFELTAYGVHGGEGPKAGKRWAVLANKQILAYQQAAAAPHELAAQAARIPPPADAEEGVRSGKYIKWGEQVIPTARKMTDDEFRFYEQTPHGGVISPGAALRTDVIHQQAEARDAGIDAETASNLNEAHLNVERAKRGEARVLDQYMGDNLSLKMPPDEKFKRGV